MKTHVLCLTGTSSSPGGLKNFLEGISPELDGLHEGPALDNHVGGRQKYPQHLNREFSI